MLGLLSSFVIIVRVDNFSIPISRFETQEKTPELRDGAPYMGGCQPKQLRVARNSHFCHLAYWRPEEEPASVSFHAVDRIPLKRKKGSRGQGRRSETQGCKPETHYGNKR